MTAQIKINFGGNPVEVMTMPNDGTLLAVGKTVPANGSKGYAPGCLFIVVDPSAGANLYVNDGTKDSSLFKAVTTA